MAHSDGHNGSREFSMNPVDREGATEKGMGRGGGGGVVCGSLHLTWAHVYTGY